MISAGDFRNGITLEIDGNVYQIMEFQHVKPGKLSLIHISFSMEERSIWPVR